MSTASPARTSAADRDAYGTTGRPAWLDVDWRTHRRWVTVGGLPLNVVDLGEGDPIVFVHGLSASWQCWLEQLPHFAQDHRVVAFDLPGFGASPMPHHKISISGYGRCVRALMEQLGIDRAAVVGNSMGGFIGAELAIQFPEVVDRLVLVSAAGLTVEHQRDDNLLRVLRALERQLTAWTGWFASQSETLVLRPRLRYALLNIVAAHPGRLSPAISAELVRGSGKRGFVEALDALTHYPIRDRLPDIQAPTLIVWGEKDRLVPVRDAFEFEKLIPDSRKVIYEDTGHLAMVERPAAFNALVEEFLHERPGGPRLEQTEGDVPGRVMSEAQAREQAVDPAD